jgi:transposase
VAIQKTCHWIASSATASSQCWVDGPRRHRDVPDWGALEQPVEETVRMNATMISLDIAKSVFQAHGEDASGRVVLQKRLCRSQVEPFFAKLPPAMVGIEACGSAHYWGRTLRTLGHEVKLIPAAYVQPFVRRNKTDARDAAAICVALARPDMRFVPIKTLEQQAARALEGSRDLLVKQQTQLINSVRGRLAEFGIVAAQGRRGFAALAAQIKDSDPAIPEAALVALRPLVAQTESLSGAIAELEAKIVEAAKADPVMRLLTTIPGVGAITAHAIVAAVGSGEQFSSARDFAAWIGLTPRQHSSGGKQRSGGISRQGDRRLRTLFTLGASTLMRAARTRTDRATAWQRAILARRPMKVAVVAQAAKTARIAFAILRSGEPYRAPQAATA